MEEAEEAMATEAKLTGSPWGETAFAEGDCLRWRVGPLGFWVRRTPMEWQVAERHYETEGLAIAEWLPSAPEDAAWTRWAAGSVLPPVRVRPVLPDRPVVVRPAQPFRILKGGVAKIYVRTPVWVRVELATEPEPLEITDLATVRLSNTWFGSLFEGVLCYWTETAARRSLKGVVSRPHLVTTPMVIHNAVEEEMPIEKICLHTQHLAVYEAGGALWTSEVKLERSDPDPTKPDRFDISDGPPEEAPGATLLSAAREKPRGGVLASAFGLLSALPGLGGEGGAE